MHRFSDLAFRSTGVYIHIFPTGFDVIYLSQPGQSMRWANPASTTFLLYQEPTDEYDVRAGWYVQDDVGVVLAFRAQLKSQMPVLHQWRADCMPVAASDRLPDGTSMSYFMGM